MLSLLTLVLAGPLPCERLQKAWDGSQCVGESKGMDANEMALLHNAVLENDLQRREDTLLTVEDRSDFLAVAAAYVCEDGGCDADALRAASEAETEGLLADGFDPVEDLGQMLQKNVDAGTLSPDFAASLLELVVDADSGLYGDDELQWRIEAMQSKEDAAALLTLQAVSRASYDYWGGEQKRPGPNVIDAVATLVWSLSNPTFSGLGPMVGALASGLYEGVHPWHLHHLRAFSWETLPGTVMFSETLWEGGFVEGSLDSTGGLVRLLDEKGEVRDERILDRATPLQPISSAPPSQNIAAKGRPLEIRIWIGGGWLVLIVQNGAIRDAWFLE